MRLFKSLILLLFTVFSMGLQAQISHGGHPMPEHLEGNNSLRSGAIETVRMPRLDTAALLWNDTAATMRCGGVRFAHSFKVDYTPENAGVVYHLQDGTQVWRLHIVSEGAHSINLIFDEYELDNQSKLFLYSPDRTTILGSFTSDNNSPSRVLATAPIDGDEVVVELVMPQGSETKLSVGSVNHDYKGLRLLPSSGTAAACQVDACQWEAHELQMRSSVVYIIDGMEFCSGNMINNTRNDGTPYMITSSHCLFDSRSNVVKEKAARSVFFFNYTKPHCFDGVEASLSMSVAGSEVAFLLPTSDAMVLKLNRRPPLDYEVYYAGWNATNQFKGPYYCYHHPNSDMLKVSVEEDQIYLGSFEYDGLFNRNKHWIVDDWEVGIMQGGSSGSALFDADGRILGSLSGGATSESCRNRGYDTYWALSVAWEEGLKKILDPNGKNLLELDGMEANTLPSKRITNWTEGDTLHTMSEYEQYAAGHNMNGIDEYAERFSVGAEQSVLYGVHLMAYEGYYSEEEPIALRIYNGDSLPCDVISEESLYFATIEYKRRSDEFIFNEVTTWGMMDNYYRLEQPLIVDSTFFVGVKLDNSAVDIFALCHTEERSGRVNTAYFKDATGWKPFEGEHPYFPYPTSLYIEPEVQVGSCKISTPAYLSDIPQSRLTANPVDQSLEVSFPSRRHLQSYGLYDMRGERLKLVRVDQEMERLQIDLNCPPGIFVLRLVFDTHVESLKVVKR